jgi:response regulator NasT
MNIHTQESSMVSLNHTKMIFDRRILVVEPHFETERSIYSKLTELGAGQMELLHSLDGLALRLEALEVDVLVLSLQSIDATALEQLIEIKKKCPIAVVVFANQYLPEMTKVVMSAGVSSYIVDDVATERVPVILDLAIERFKHSQSLSKELQQAQQQLSDRKLVSKAKGIIMRQKNLSEDEAYIQIRSSAMNQGKTMAELSKRIISVFEILE